MSTLILLSLVLKFKFTQNFLFNFTVVAVDATIKRTTYEEKNNNEANYSTREGNIRSNFV